MYKTGNRISKNNGLKVFFTVFISSIIFIGIIWILLTQQNYQIMPNPETVITYTEQPQKNSQSNQVGKITPNSYNLDQSGSPQINSKSLEFDIHQQINYVRENMGIKPLSYNNNLAYMARQHSQDMSINNYFDHISPDGKTLQNRLYLAKIPCYVSGENIQENYVSTPNVLNSIIQTWMSSSGHKENILSGYYSSEGIGVYISSDNIFITEDFC